MTRTLIIDDEAPARAALRGLLQAHADVALVGEADTLEQGAKRLGEGDYDLVFLDVHLRGGTGFDLVPFVRPEARVVFVTGSDQHAVRAFDVNALDYLTKPIRPQRLAEALRRSAGSRAERTAVAPAAPALTLAPGDFVYVKMGNDTSRFLELADIAAISSNENYSEVHLASGERLLVRRTMKSWAEVLPATQFVRVHRTTLINLARYRGAARQSYETTLLNIDGLAEPVRASFRFLPELRERLETLGRRL